MLGPLFSGLFIIYNFKGKSGKVVEVNKPLEDSPGMVNEDAYGEGWILKLEHSDASEIEGLMDASQYETYLSEEA